MSSLWSSVPELIEAADTETGAGIMGVITGRAIYEGTIDLALAQQLADGYPDLT